MTNGFPHPSVDELLDAFISAWHAGDAPSSAAYADQAAADDRDELTQLIAAFLTLAPTVPLTDARAAELADDPLVARIAALEGERWDGSQPSVAGAPEASIADGPGRSGADAAALSPWGERLRGLREGAGLSVGDLAGRFAERFGLADVDAGEAPNALAALESGTLPSAGVAARAARALEELLAAPKGALAAGAAPAFGGPVLRGALPDDPGERAKFADLLREVDAALEIEADAHFDEPETLSELLGA